MNIVEFFNPRDPEHLRAFRHVGLTGAWPQGFIPEGLEFPPIWQMAVIGKMADCWMEQQIGPAPIVLRPQGIKPPGQK